jgi:hypothetical protein
MQITCCTLFAISGPISSLLKFLVSRMPEEGSAAARGAAVPRSTDVRSGNIWGVNEAELAADMARKISLSAAAAEQQAAVDYSGVGITGGRPIQQRSSATAAAAGYYASAPSKSPLREICMRGAGLMEIPVDFWQAPQYLQKLDLSCNPLGGIPPEVWLRCHQLQSLNLGTCGLQAWPLPQAHRSCWN